MNVRRLACLPILLLTGCTWIPYAMRNVTNAPLGVVADYRYRAQACALARRALEECAGSHAYSSPYRHGFEAGFIYQTQRDGTGEPPALPPCRYRYPVLKTPEQHQQIMDWHAGFRHGAEVSKAGRWHERILIPVDQPTRVTPPRFSVDVIPYPPARPAVGTAEELPPPLPGLPEPPPPQPEGEQ